MYLDYVLIIQYYIWKLNISSIWHPKIDMTLVMVSPILMFASPCLTNLIHGDTTTRPKKQLHLRWPHLSQNIPALSLPRPDFQKHPVTDTGWIAIQKGGHGSRLGDKGNPSFVWKRLVENQWKNHKNLQGKCKVRGTRIQTKTNQIIK